MRSRSGDVGRHEPANAGKPWLVLTRKSVKIGRLCRLNGRFLCPRGARADLVFVPPRHSPCGQRRFPTGGRHRLLRHRAEAVQPQITPAMPHRICLLADATLAWAVCSDRSRRPCCGVLTGRQAAARSCATRPRSSWCSKPAPSIVNIHGQKTLDAGRRKLSPRRDAKRQRHGHRRGHRPARLHPHQPSRGRRREKIHVTLADGEQATRDRQAASPATWETDLAIIKIDVPTQAAGDPDRHFVRPDDRAKRSSPSATPTATSTRSRAASSAHCTGPCRSATPSSTTT